MVHNVSVPAICVMVSYCGVAITTSDDTFHCGLGVTSSLSDSVLWYSYALCNVICHVECVCLC